MDPIAIVTRARWPN